MLLNDCQKLAALVTAILDVYRKYKEYLSSFLIKYLSPPNRVRSETP